MRSQRPQLVRSGLFVTLGLALAGGVGCGAPTQALRAELRPMALGAVASPAVPLDRDHFTRDGSGSIPEEDLRRVLAAPTFLEERTRLGVVPVAGGYRPEQELPLGGVTAALSEALERSGLFDLTTEVTTDWPTDGGIAGLRELAARYRAPYLLLYRARFVDRSWTNGWGWLYPTLLGLLAAPARTVEVAGVVEATLFDVRTGTLLFTLYQRASSIEDQNLWNHAPKLRARKEALLRAAAARLASQVVDKVRRLAASRPPPAPPLALPSAVAG